jgi:hypothetical protein
LTAPGPNSARKTITAITPTKPYFSTLQNFIWIPQCVVWPSSLHVHHLRIVRHVLQ